MTVEAERLPYRKLPGRRRGILRGASLWLAPDHLLSVKSLRFREEYKRFHLRDVQAIVIAQAPRFHISTRAIAVACLWLIAFLAARNLEPWIPAALWSAAVCLVGAWLFVSLARSCRCLIYTAVSSEELPSIYRTWTARQLLSALEPRIRELQGTLEGDWPEALEGRDVGPPGSVRPIPRDTPAVILSNTPAAADPHPAAPGRTAVSDVFLASLFGQALLNLATLHSLTRTTQWIWYALACVQIGAAILIFVQYYRGVIHASMQKLAITSLIAMGVSYYFRQVLEGASRANSSLGLAQLSQPAYTVIREVDAAICVLLGIVGAALSLLPKRDSPA